MASKLRSPKSEKRLTPHQRAVAAALLVQEVVI